VKQQVMPRVVKRDADNEDANRIGKGFGSSTLDIGLGTVDLIFRNSKLAPSFYRNSSFSLDRHQLPSRQAQSPVHRRGELFTMGYNGHGNPHFVIESEQ